MPGYQKILKNNFCSIWLIIILFCLALLWGCKSSKESTYGKSKSDITEFLSKYENTFNPREFNPNVDSIQKELKLQREAIDASKLVSVALPETIQGFRVQVLFTPDFEQANKIKDSISLLLPDEWTYTVYDAPYYKIRVGNFVDRIVANQMVKKLVSFGFLDAWIVPDKVIKNPPPRLHDIEIVPEKQPPNPNR